MEGSSVLRFGAISAMFLGALYVLAPNFVAPPEVDVSSFEAKVEKEDALQAFFVVADGEADRDTARAASARLAAAGLDIARVEARADRVIVYLRKGERKDRVAQVLARRGEGALYAVSDLDDGAAGGVRQPREGATPIDVPFTVTPGADADRIAFGGPLPEGVTAVALAVDGAIVGTAPASVDAPVAIAWLDPADRGPTAALASGPLPEPLTRWTPPPVEERPVEEAEEAEAVNWWASMLPNTRINLGLDLQGGIDLTLQVDQDAAVAAAVQRDARVLSDRLTKEGVDATARRDRTRPAVRVRTSKSLSEVSDVVSDVLREYVYLETLSEEGATVHVWRMDEVVEARLRDQAVEQNLETLRKRIDATGVKEPSIVKMDGGRINIQLPGLADADSAIAAIGTQATLSFRMVDEEADTIALDRALGLARQALPEDQFEELELVNEWLRDNGHLSGDRVVRWQYEARKDGALERTIAMPLFDEVVLTGADVDDASVGWDQNNTPRVLIDFKPRGATVFCDVTRANVGKQFAILLDDRIRSAPSIREAICGGSASIEMGTSADALDEANTLALVLRSGALTAPVDIGEVRVIGASLGADAITSGTYGAGIGGVITLLFMVLWYRTPGVIADVALVLNVLLVFAMLALFGATLTLPGIAGVALTVGMAVDANIIIFERVREELKLGVTPRKAVDAGYDKGLVAVLDANITTAIAAIVLYSYGTGPIRGFAVTLLIGIFTTLVTALFVTRTFMETITRNSAARLRI